jgi:hypothetical protein
MRCFSKVSPNGSVAQFSKRQDDLNYLGDGGGTPVFKWFSIPEFGELLFSCQHIPIMIHCFYESHQIVSRGRGCMHFEFDKCMWINLLSRCDLSSVGYANISYLISSPFRNGSNVK